MSKLSSYYEHFEKIDLPQIVINLLYAQIFYFINASLFNHIIEKAELCKAATGFAIKMTISQLEEWASKQHDILLPLIRGQFDYITEAANVLVIDKSIFLSEEVVASIFVKLNPVQIKHILASFSPDEYASGERAEVSDAVVQALDGHVFKSADKTLLLNPNNFVITPNS
eukprot:TRINITY_DN10176_c0_g1_i2.p1 TRINITY_DN10176_c0_g1~~TRINITY_DN10176_c0_g1_i2.p1  ORF type:complete len:170 (+),score=28.10 TRINITY_DN10176_c0_g1_i2:265-774(+)